MWDQYEGLMFDKVVIYRGVDGGTPQPIAQLAAGNFTFTDLLPPSGMLSYKIELVGDFNCGTIQDLQLFSNPITVQITSDVDNIPSSLSLEIFPNPATEFLTINQNHGQLDYVIFRLDGKIIDSGICRTSIDIRALNDGVYYILFNSQGQETIHRFVKL